MSLPQQPKPGKLVIGLLMKNKALFEPLTADLELLYGAPDMVSSWMSFGYTSYYEPEFGFPLFRRMLAFGNLIEQQDLAAIKIATNRLEASYADTQNRRRRVNIDPGYLLYERFVLASGKNFTHRIYVGKGIYADLTLIYRGGSFETLPWTYPDYADRPIMDFLEQARRKYAFDIRSDGEI